MTAATIAQQPLPPEMKSLHIQDNAMTENNNSNNNSSNNSSGSGAEMKPHDDFDDNGALPADDEKVLLEGPYCRLLGDTEHNWCRAVSSGTGITVLSLLFSRVLEASVLQQAVVSVQLQHPRLRSQLLWINGHPAFKVSDHPYVTVEVVDATSPDSPDDPEAETETGVLDPEEEEWRTAELQDVEKHSWMAHLEAELNMNMWPERQHCLEPIQMFVVRLYLLPENRSLLVIRVHTAVCDRVAAATVMVDLLKSLREIIDRGPEETVAINGVDGIPSQPSSPGHYDSGGMTTHNFMSVEDAIPPGKANKPFWSHGIDLLGYSLGTRRHALLPFDEPNSPRCSKFFHCILSKDHTKLLLEVLISSSCLHRCHFFFSFLFLLVVTSFYLRKGKVALHTISRTGATI